MIRSEDLAGLEKTHELLKTLGKDNAVLKDVVNALILAVWAERGLAEC